MRSKVNVIVSIKNNRVTCVSLNGSRKSNQKKKKTTEKLDTLEIVRKKKIFFQTIHRLSTSIIELIKINRVPSYFFETPWNAILWNRMKINGKTSKLENVDTVRNINLRQLKDNRVS